MVQRRQMGQLLGGILLGLLVCAAVAGAYLWGALRPLDAALLDLQYRLTPRAATGDLVIVKIDPKSIAALDRWPWPRTNHAELTNKLIAAGARSIAFDIDFSSHSVPAADAALAQAFHDADNRIILPVFKQSRIETGDLAQVTFSAPLEILQREARLAAVTVQPEADGRIWHGLTSDLWKGWRLPTVSGLLADHGEDPDASFLIDYGIDPTTLPQISYVDILQGRFDPRAIAGKTVLVGATAVELGDHYAVPIYTDLPGVIIQALAVESLKQGLAPRELAPIWILALTLVFGLPAWVVFRRTSWRFGAAASMAGAAAIAASCFAISLRYAIHIDAAAPIVGVAVAYLVALLQTLDLQALHIFHQQIEAAQRRALMKTFIESSFDGIVIAGENGAINMINPAAAAMLGCDAEAVIDSPVDALLPHGSAADAADPLHIGAQSKWDTQLDGPGRERLDVEISLSTAEILPTSHPFERRRGGRNVFIYVLHDITERKRAEETQRAATAAALANSRAKTEFLTNMSHELRTPLNAVIGFSEMIKDQVFGPVGEAHYVEYAQDINAAGTHLLDIINDILSISRIELGEMKLYEGEIDVAHGIDSVIRLVALRAQERSIAVGVSVEAGLPPLLADERALKQILLNVLSNAIKFTNEGGEVQVTARRAAAGGLAIAIADNGIGITPEAMARVAEPFFQADGSLERRHEGLGLGLAIVRDLMKLHDGSFAIDSKPGAGTTVTLTFPPARMLADPAAEVATPEIGRAA